MRRTLCCFLLALCAFTFGQPELFGENSFTSQRGLSGLSGGGFVLGRDGKFSAKGATTLSTPIAYTLGPRLFYVGASILSSTLSPRFPERIDFNNDVVRKSNGSGVFMGGFGTPLGDLCVGGLITTGDLDSSLNVQLTPKGQNGKVKVAIGCQDVFSSAAAHNGSIQATLGGGNSRSPYVVGTAEVGGGAFASLGAGVQRFKGAFGSLSIPVGPFVAFAEYDTFNINWGVTARFHHREFGLGAHEQSGWVSVGVVRGKYLYWSLGFGF